ncbi:MAG: ankyrin repeat domain-containing protein [Sphingobacteriales bacterium]|nr:ankyrin repeat domain-containing protein [Sphingobacteriales bacterium]
MNSIKQARSRTCLLFFACFIFSLFVQAQTPLEKALSANDTVTALQLIRQGENPNQQVSSGDGSLLIRYCRYAENDPIAFFLLSNGAKPDTLRSAAGRTALHVAAAYYACETLCTALLNAGADINARTHDGATPLMLAAQSAKLRLVKLLIQKGADPLLKDKKGKTAYDYALAADALADLPEFRKKMEEACGFNKSETISFLKEKTSK